MKRRGKDDANQLGLNFDAPKPEAPRQSASVLNGSPAEYRMAPRPSLIQPKETARITKEAIERAEHLTDDQRKIEYLQAIRAVAERMEFFRCDHVWDYLGRVGDGGRDNGSGLGPMMKLACASGVMRPANEFERSQRGPTHGRPQRLWKSLIYRGSTNLNGDKTHEPPEQQNGHQ